MTMQCRNVAILCSGCVATGEFGQGIPALVGCLRELATDNKLTVYSLLHIDRDRVPSGIRIHELKLRTRSLRLNILLLCCWLILDHARNRYDIIQTESAYPYGWVAILLSKLLRVPCLVALSGQELADIPDIAFGDLRIPCRKARICKTCESADSLVALSRFQAIGLNKLGLSPELATVIPLGVDTTRFPYASMSLTTPITFLHISYGRPVKDLEMLIETFRLVNTAVASRLLIVGPNHITQETQSLVEERSLEPVVELLGSIPNEQLIKYMQQAHFLLLTSRYESQGVVINEAMSAGVVVCATRVGLAFDLGDEFCISADTRDSQGLADKIIAVINDTEKYETLRACAHRWCENRDVRWTAAQYRKIYEHL